MVDFFNWLTFQNAYFYILYSIWFGYGRFNFNSSILSVISTFADVKAKFMIIIVMHFLSWSVNIN